MYKCVCRLNILRSRDCVYSNRRIARKSRDTPWSYLDLETWNSNFKFVPQAKFFTSFYFLFLLFSFFTPFSLPFIPFFFPFFFSLPFLINFEFSSLSWFLPPPLRGGGAKVRLYSPVYFSIFEDRFLHYWRKLFEFWLLYVVIIFFLGGGVWLKFAQGEENVINFIKTYTLKITKYKKVALTVADTGGGILY